MIKCLICDKEFQNRVALCNHLCRKHSLKKQEYYDFIQGTPTYTDEKHKNSTCAVLNGKRQYAKILIKRKVGK